MPWLMHIHATPSKAAHKKGHLCVLSNTSDSGRGTRQNLAQILPRPGMARGGLDVTECFTCLTAI